MNFKPFGFLKNRLRIPLARSKTIRCVSFNQLRYKKIYGKYDYFYRAYYNDER